MGKKKEKKGQYSKLSVRGFFRAQLVESGTGRIMGDSGWIENKLTDGGLQDLALLFGGSGSQVSHAVLATQTDAVNVTQATIIGSTNAFQALNLSTSGTCTLTCTASFASGDLGASCEVGAVGLFPTNANANMFAAQTFATSAWETNQDFNLTYQIRFATA